MSQQKPVAIGIVGWTTVVVAVILIASGIISLLPGALLENIIAPKSTLSWTMAVIFQIFFSGIGLVLAINLLRLREWARQLLISYFIICIVSYYGIVLVMVAGSFTSGAAPLYMAAAIIATFFALIPTAVLTLFIYFLKKPNLVAHTFHSDHMERTIKLTRIMAALLMLGYLVFFYLEMTSQLDNIATMEKEVQQLQSQLQSQAQEHALPPGTN